MPNSLHLSIKGIGNISDKVHVKLNVAYLGLSILIGIGTV